MKYVAFLDILGFKEKLKTMNLFSTVAKGSPNENWRELDVFIRNAFDKNVLSDFQTRFLKYLRKSLF